MSRALSILSLFAFCATAFAMDDVNDYEAQTADAKLNHVRQCIADTAYDEMPEISGPGISILNFLFPSFVAKAFTNNGDVMEEGREKLIHRFGTVIEVAFVVDEDSELNLTGLFASGADYGLLRFSLAEPSSGDNFKPGFAMKLFRNGVASANVFAMPSLDGVASSNLFSADFLTSLPEPEDSIKMRILNNRFEAGAEAAGMPNGNIRALTFTNMASFNKFGVPSTVNAPYALVFRPTKAAKKLLKNKVGDFRTNLNGLGAGTILFEVYAVMAEDDTNGRHIASVKAVSNFIASAYADELLYFKHPFIHALRH